MKYLIRLFVFIFFINLVCSCSNGDIRPELDLNSISGELLEVDNDSAILLANKSLELNLGPEHDYYSHFLISYAYKEKNEFIKSLKHLLLASDLIPEDEKFNPNRASINKNIGRILERYSGYDLALEYYDEAFKYVNESQKAGLLLNTAHILKEQGELEKAAKTYIDALELADEHGQTTRKTMIANQLALVRVRIGEYESARDLLFSIISDDNIPNYDKYAGRAYHNIGHSYMAEGDYRAAIKFYTEALKLKKLGSERFFSLKDIGECYSKLGNYNSSITYLEEAETHYKSLPCLPENYSIFKLLQEVHMNNGSINRSQQFLQLFYRENDTHEKKRNQINEINNAEKIQKIISDHYERRDITEYIDLLKLGLLGLAGLTLFCVFHLLKYWRKRKIGKELVRKHLINI